MATVLYSSPIFGPIHSRRLGVSLGINLMPEDGKICTFDCVYCECGRNAEHHTHLKRPSREEVREALRTRLLQMKAQGPFPNVLTFAGNGEPTAHPQFADIVNDIIALRDEFFPDAKVSVLSNATRVIDDAVFGALMKIDNNILKLDTVNIDYIKMVDKPVGRYDLNQIIDRLKSFKGHVIIQTMFMKGSIDGVDIDNTADGYVLPWIEVLKQIGPEKVMIYTIDRETPIKTLEKASRETLDGIVSKLKSEGFDASASY